MDDRELDARLTKIQMTLDAVNAELQATEEIEEDDPTDDEGSVEPDSQQYEIEEK